MIFDQINLTTRERIDHRIRFLLYGGMALLVLFISVVNLVKGYQIYQERAAYQVKLEQLQQQTQKLQTAGTGSGEVSKKKYQSLMNRGLRVNRLIALDLFPWVKVLSALEKSQPDVVIIDSFRPVNGFTRIHLAGRTDSLEKLVRFQERLETNDLFAAVVLDNMGLGEGDAGGSEPNPGGRMEFKLRCRLRLDQLFPEETHGALWLALKKAPQVK
jgi:hypothetical protein